MESTEGVIADLNEFVFPLKVIINMNSQFKVNPKSHDDIFCWDNFIKISITPTKTRFLPAVILTIKWEGVAIKQGDVIRKFKNVVVQWCRSKVEGV